MNPEAKIFVQEEPESCCVCSEEYTNTGHVEHKDVIRVYTYIVNGNTYFHKSGEIVREYTYIDMQCWLLPCGHKFHKNCIDKWMFQKRNCPLCRATY